MIRDYKTLASLMEPLLAPNQQTFSFGQINFAHRDLREGGRMVYVYRDRVVIGGASLGENVFWGAGGEDLLLISDKVYDFPFIGLTDGDHGYKVPIIRASYPEVRKKDFAFVFLNLPIHYYAQGFVVDSFALAQDAEHLGSTWFDASKEVERLYVRYDPTHGMNDDSTIVVVGDVPNTEAIVDASKRAGLHHLVEKSEKKVKVESRAPQLVER